MVNRRKRCAAWLGRAGNGWRSRREVGGGTRGALGGRASRAAHLERLARSESSFQFEPGWLIGSGLLYLAGLSAYGRFYERVLRASPTPVRLVPALRAYLVSHLGKYVPGKAMVVVVRAGMVVPFGARASTAAIATFYETLVMMAAGGLIAAAGFAAAVGSHPVGFDVPLLGPGRAAALPARRCVWAGVGTGVPDRWWYRRCSAGWRGWSACPSRGGPEAMPRLTGRLLVQGLLWSSAGWVLLGLSQLAVVRAFDPARMGAVDGSRSGTGRDRQRGAGDGGRFRGGRAPRRTGCARGSADVGAWPPRWVRIRRWSRRCCCGWSGWSPSWWPRRSWFLGFDVRRRLSNSFGSRSRFTHDQRRRSGS